jgi:hypothetical protein
MLVQSLPCPGVVVVTDTYEGPVTILTQPIDQTGVVRTPVCLILTKVAVKTCKILTKLFQYIDDEHIANTRHVFILRK